MWTVQFLTPLDTGAADDSRTRVLNLKQPGSLNWGAGLDLGSQHASTLAR